MHGYTCAFVHIYVTIWVISFDPIQHKHSFKWSFTRGSSWPHSSSLSIWELPFALLQFPSFLLLSSSSLSFCLPFKLTLLKTFFEMFTKASIRPCFFPGVKSTLPTTSSFWLLSLTLGGGEDFCVCQLALLGRKSGARTIAHLKSMSSGFFFFFHWAFSLFYSRTLLPLKLHMTLTEDNKMRDSLCRNHNLHKIERILWLW